MTGTHSALMVPASHASTADFIAAAHNAAPSAGQSGSADSGFSFGDLLDIVNPLQHLPVISTLYRAITGDKIGDAEQVAGDALYGGLIGLGSSLANLVFKDATGKDFGDTVLAWAEDATGIQLGDTPTAVAANTLSEPAKPATPTAPAVTPTAPAELLAGLIQTPPPTAALTAVMAAATPATAPAAARTTAILADPSALMAAFKAQGVDPALGLQAMLAYEKSLGLSAQTATLAQP